VAVNQYGLTWGTLLEACRESIITLHLPITDFDDKVYVALCKLCELYNTARSDVFRRWNGANFNNVPIPFSAFEITTPVKGKVLNDDAALDLDQTIAAVYSQFAQPFVATSYDQIVKYYDETILRIGGSIITLLGEPITFSGNLAANYYAVEGNMLYILAKPDVTAITYTYYHVPPRPALATDVVRIPHGLLPLLKVIFKREYLGDFNKPITGDLRLEYNRLIKQIR
jgi:hypothetical protein